MVAGTAVYRYVVAILQVTAISTSADKEAEARGFGATNFIATEAGLKAIKGTQEVCAWCIALRMHASSVLHCCRAGHQ